MTKRYNYSRNITWAEAERAIYLDFETHEKGPPFLVGRLIGEADPRLTVLDPSLYAAAKGSPLLKADTDELGHYLDELLDRCEVEDRRIIAFSDWEIEVVDRFAPSHLKRMTARYWNARPRVQQWFKKHQPETYSSLEKQAKKRKYVKQQRVGFKDYLSADFVPCEFPRNLKGRFSPSGAARIVRDQLQARDDDYSELAEWRKRRWTNLLKYNKADCECLRCLTLFVLSQDESA